METPRLRQNVLENADNSDTTTPGISNRSSLAPLMSLKLFDEAKVNLPSKRLLESLYKIAIDDMQSHQVHLAKNSTGNYAVLSLEDVWLPAAVHQIQKNLKSVQGKVQRDGTASEIKEVERARLYVFDQVKRSLKVLQHQRQCREEQYRLELQHEREQQLEQMKRDFNRQQEMQRKNHPYNQELWREVAALMTEMQKLDKEERLWEEALKRLPTESTKPTTVEKEVADSSSDNMQIESSENTPLTHELGTTLQLLDDLQLWTRRVRTSLAQIHPAMEQAEALRTELYEQHQSTRFKGYPGMQQPKDLLRILSQDPDGDDSY